MSSKRERVEAVVAARERGRVAQAAFGPDSERRNLLTAPIYRTPSPDPEALWAMANPSLGYPITRHEVPRAE